MKINEVTKPTQEQLKIGQFIDKIYPSCSEIINLYKMSMKKYPKKKWHFFIRIGSVSKDVMTKVPYKNRKPKDMDLHVHRGLVKVMKSLGYSAHRGNSSFMASVNFFGEYIMDPTHYSIPYIVFPLNGFEYTWSPKIRDLYSDLNWGDKHVLDTIGFGTKKITPEVLRYFKDTLRYQTTNLIEALHLRSEVMFTGKYHNIHVKYHNYVKNYIKQL